MRHGLRRLTLGLGLALSVAASAAMGNAAPRFAFEAVVEPAAFGDLSLLVGFTPSGGLAGVWQGPQGQVAGVIAPDGTASGHLPLPDDFLAADFDETHGVVGQWQGRAWRVGPGLNEPVAGLPADQPSHASAINASGAVIGWLGDPGGESSRMFVAAPGQGLRTFGVADGNALPWDINDRGEAIFGTYGQGQFRVDLASGQVTPFGQDYAYGINRALINERGDIAVDAGWRYEERVAVFARDGSRVDVTQPPDLPFANLRDFNDRGEVLLEAFTGGPGVPYESRSFLHTPGGGLLDILAAVDVPQGWSDLAFTDLSDDGDIAGWGTQGGERRLFMLNAIAGPVPEASTVWLMAIGCVCLAGHLVRCQRQPSPQGRRV
jgi:hypothetical protein